MRFASKFLPAPKAVNKKKASSVAGAGLRTGCSIRSGGLLVALLAHLAVFLSGNAAGVSAFLALLLCLVAAAACFVLLVGGDAGAGESQAGDDDGEDGCQLHGFGLFGLCDGSRAKDRHANNQLYDEQTKSSLQSR